MTKWKFEFIYYLDLNSKFFGKTTYSRDNIIAAFLNEIENDERAYLFLECHKENLSIYCKKAFGHLAINKPINVSYPRYLLFLCGFKKCKLSKNIYPLSEFSKTKINWTGYQDYSIPGRKEWYNSSKENISEYNKLYRAQNLWKIAAITAKRRAKKLNATPLWLTKEQWLEIENKYKEAEYLTNTTGIKYVIDHYFPLQGKYVSGLHVPNNLQVITEKENREKSSKHESEDYWQ